MTLQEGWAEWLKFFELALQSLLTIVHKVHRNALKSLAQLLSVVGYEKIDLLIPLCWLFSVWGIDWSTH